MSLSLWCGKRVLIALQEVVVHHDAVLEELKEARRKADGST
jgi:hypothetical protein